MQQYVIDHLDHDFNVVQSFIPQNLHFILNDEDVSTIEYEISANHLDLDGNPVITLDTGLYTAVAPWNTHWRLRYDGIVDIMAGPHVSVNMAYGGNYISVAGQDWVGYFNRRFQPWNGSSRATFFDNVIGTPPVGLYYSVVTRDISDALTDILTSILSMPNSMPITYGSLVSAGVDVDYYQISLGDTTTLLDIVKTICAYYPGVAWEITPGMHFHTSGNEPRWYGDPDSLGASDDSDPSLIWVVNSGQPPISLDFTNTGPGATHMQGEGQGTSTKFAKTIGNEANQEVFWRLDKQVSFDDAITRASVNARTREQLAFDLNPIHEIPLVLDPDVVDQQYAISQGDDPGDDDGFFWTSFKPGRAIWINLQLLAHLIDSPHHIVSMDCSVNANGACSVSIQQNQIYDTSGQAQVDEG